MVEIIDEVPVNVDSNEYTNFEAEVRLQNKYSNYITIPKPFGFKKGDIVDVFIKKTKELVEIGGKWKWEEN